MSYQEYIQPILNQTLEVGCEELKDAESQRIMMTAINTRLIHSGEVRIWCEALGNPSDPAVIFISGAGAHAHFWTDEFCSKLVNGGFFTIRFDHRDSGLSSAVDFEKNPYSALDLAEDVLAILDAFQIHRAHVVGHSMGGLIAQLLAIRYPGRVLKAVSLSVATVGSLATPSSEVMQKLMENKPTHDYRQSLPGFMRSWEILNGDFSVDRQMAEKYTQELYTRSLHPVGVAWNHIRCQENLGDFEEKLKEIQAPILVIHGGKDPLIPVEGAIATARAVPHGKLTVIPGMGHMLFNRRLESIIVGEVLKHLNQPGI